MNKRLKLSCVIPSCVLIIGDRGAGKSSVLALIADEWIKRGVTVYCQYPYKGVRRIPTVKVPVSEGYYRYDIDKKWLYTTDLTDSVVLIDEGATVWGNRKWNTWTESDDDLFNFIRKNNVHMYIATQMYDKLDLNVRRACDETWYLTKGWWHFSHIESSRSITVKVADNNSEVVGRMFKAGARKVNWDICEIPLSHYRFWRKPYYDKFFTLHVFSEKLKSDCHLWDDLVDFEGAKR